MNDKEKRLVDISTLNGILNWLVVLPITEFGFELSKQHPLDETHLIVVRELIYQEVSHKYVKEESSTECRSYNRQVQRIFSTVISKLQSKLIRQD